LQRVELQGDRKQFFTLDNAHAWKFVRLNIFPDGGVARLRLFGEPSPDWGAMTERVELSALKNGGRIIAYNDAHYGDLWALLSEGRAAAVSREMTGS